ncbi:MAG: 3-dehydroquinate synthase [Pyrinomonadaceae bacterium]|nr:3-dehydroquinate synthase [Pyrinomonadaceae bacterium]
MKNNKVTVSLSDDSHEYDIAIGDNLLENSGEWARNCLSKQTKKIALISNAKVFGLYGETVKNSLESANFEVVVFLMNDGERYKSLRTLEKVLKFFSENQIKRTDAVVALGGGVVGDLAGFAAAVFQRGTAFLQIPTTLLAMIDSSVGGKTGVNTEFGKNLVGAFHQPHGVLIDIAVLQTLPRRELTAGFCEAVKQGAISNEKLFTQTAEFLKKFPPNKFKKYFFDDDFISEIEKLITAQVAFKAEIVQQDEREDAARRDGKSRKILNFGHTLAHALEKVTDYKRFKHGEAVGYGILFAAELSKTLEMFDNNKLDLLNDVLRRLGKLPDASDINLKTVSETFAFDKKNIGKSLQWILLEDIGKPKIVDDREISPKIIDETLKKVLQP